MPTTGKVKSAGSKPSRHFTVETSPGPPPVTVEFNVDVDTDDYNTALAAYSKGGTVDVTGTPPTCTGITAR